MKSKSARFQISMTPLLVGIGVLLVIGGGTAVYAHRDLLHFYTNPGSLSGVNRSGDALGGFNSHAMFEEDCAHCHAPVHCITDTKCQDCHMDIARQRAEAVGLHSLLPGTEKCQTCHTEHQGREAVISQVLLRNIDHQALSGFSLGLHETRFDGAPMACEDCHTQGRFAADEVSCVACHEEADGELMVEHSAQQGENCLGCHDGTRAIIEFVHDDVFMLQGDHEGLGCVDCHEGALFTVAAQTCDGCHEEPDIHAGQFGLECARCHTAVAWAPAQLTQHRFALTHGDGVLLTCDTCHVAAYTAVSCASCHALPDMQTAHPPDRAPNYNAMECAACHPTGEPIDTAPLAQIGN